MPTINQLVRKPRKPPVTHNKVPALAACPQKRGLELLAQGKSNKRISRALGMAEGTVRIHVTAILKAFGVANRTEAAITVDRLLRQPLTGDLGATGEG